MSEKNDDDAVAVVKKYRKGDLVAAAKRNADSQALSQKHRDNVMDFDALMNKAPFARLPVVISERRKKKNETRKTKKAMRAVQDHVGN